MEVRAIKIEPGEAAKEIKLDTALESLQREVDGLIEITYPFDDNVCIIGNDEAKLIGKEGTIRIEGSEKLGYKLEDYEAVIYTSVPDDGEEVLTCSRYGHIAIDKFENDPDYGCCFEENGDMDGIVAWMPLPKPWEGEE